MNKDIEAITIDTYSTTAQQWAKSHAVVNDWLETTDRFQELLSSGKILELGCGGGRDAAELLSRGYGYVGTDASTGMIEVVKSEVPDGEFKVMNVYDVGSLGEKFDGFWACAVLLHIPRKRIDEALQAIRSTLKDGAIGMISMKDGDTEDFEVRDKDGAHEERLFVYWRKDEFLDVLKRNGFELVDYTYRPVSERTKWHAFFVKKV